MITPLQEGSALQSGKNHTGENFPVASKLIAPQYRPPVMAFYKFVRFADDISDHESAAPDEKLRLLEEMRATLAGESDTSPEGLRLRASLAERGLSPVHAFDLLEAFRRDCTKLRTADWDDLIDYCCYSAMPVGRFVLAVHGESESLWPANDALCAALQVINHLQDCAKDYQGLNRVYLPEDMLAAAEARAEDLAAPQASPALKAVIHRLAAKNAELLARAKPFACGIRNGRLALEVDLIQTLAEDLNAKLMRRDPLSEPVHHSKLAVARLFLGRLPAFTFNRLARRT
jgi:hydroxysqualene synthase